MKLSIRDDSKNYTCTVIKLPPKQKVEELDNLVKVTVFGNDVLIQKDTDENQLYLFFPSESKISRTYLSVNNEYKHNNLNIDPTAKPGFFEDNGRVKSIKFKGVISTGYIAPVSTLYPLMDNWREELKEDDEFTDIDDINICKKYVIYHIHATTPGKPKDKSWNRLSDFLVRNQFRIHQETAQLARNLHLFKPEDIIVITDKWHGSSVILSKVLINKKLNLWQKFLNLIGGQVRDNEYGYIYSSGKPRSGLPKGIEGSWKNDNNDYYSENIWKILFDEYKHTLEDGISIYGEVVGFLPSGKAIQKNYDYGCKTGVPQFAGAISNYHEHKFVVYRITYTKPDGNVIEFSWQQIKDYCKKYNLETVKELYHGPGTVLAPFPSSEQWREEMFNRLQKHYLEGDCKYCINKVPAEGIVVRIDGRETYMAYKLKSKKFLLGESKELDKGEVNIEE